MPNAMPAMGKISCTTIVYLTEPLFSRAESLRRTDKMSVDNDVIQVAVRFSVQVTTAGDQTKTRVGQVAVNLLGGEVTFRILRNLIDNEECGGSIASLNRHFVTGSEMRQLVKNSLLPLPVNVSGNDSRSPLARSGCACIPTSSCAVYRYFHGTIGVQPEVHERGVHTNGRNLHAHGRRLWHRRGFFCRRFVGSWGSTRQGSWDGDRNRSVCTISDQQPDHQYTQASYGNTDAHRRHDL